MIRQIARSLLVILALRLAMVDNMISSKLASLPSTPPTIISRTPIIQLSFDFMDAKLNRADMSSHALTGGDLVKSCSLTPSR